jgi:predicted nucleic acid-binding protein
MKLVVNDASILFDLIDVNLVTSLFKLNYSFCTTDFILNEITDVFQKSAIQKFIDDESLAILSFTDIGKIYHELNNHKGLSSQDCSVLITARENDAILLTGDSHLRKIAESDGIEVHGILWVFDELFDNHIITAKNAHSKLSHLMKINTFLPQDECIKRLNKWRL